MATKKTAVTTEETSKKETAKAETPVTEKTVKSAAKKTAAKKTAEKKETAPKKTAAKRTAAKKAAAEESVILQFGGREFNDKDLIVRVKEIWTKDLGRAESDLKDIKVYVKPDELMAYYVINNDEVSGSIEL